MYIILAILLLAVLIVAHEFGHFTAARLMKIDVREFSVGFGPKLAGWKSKKYETTFAIRAIPMGGYCSFYGEDDATGESKDDPRRFGRHSVWKRMFVILMGPVMNFVLAFAAATVLAWCTGIPTGEVDPYIQDVTASGPARDAGIKAGDVVTEINGVNMLDGTTDTLTGAIASWKEGDAPLRVKILRNGQVIETEMTPEWDEKAGRMMVGVYISGTVRFAPAGFLGGLREAWQECTWAGGAILDALRGLVTRGEGLEDTAGPVGIVSMISSQVEGEVRLGGVGAGAGVYTRLLIVISINLGLMNLLPIPGLDGSRLVFGIIEAIRGKPVEPKREALVHLTGMVLLLGLMAFFTFRDVMRLFN